MNLRNTGYPGRARTGPARPDEVPDAVLGVPGPSVDAPGHRHKRRGIRPG